MLTLELPNEIQVEKKLGSGRRSEVYLARYRDNVVIVKAYRSEYIDKYRSRYKVDIGEFEFNRNKTAYDCREISQFVAKPYKLLRAQDGYASALVQEYVDGIWLLDLMCDLGRLPAETLQAGYRIVEEAAKLGLFDLDISPGNIQVVQDSAGNWFPKLYDFNLMPQYLRPPNPFMRIGFVLGLRSKNHRDYRSLRQWKKLGEQAAQ